MLAWLKDKWEFVAAGVAVLFVFVLGRKLEIALAHKKYTDSRIALRSQYRAAQTELERTTAQRKMELLETAKDNPEEIDRILMEEFNISKLK